MALDVEIRPLRPDDDRTDFTCGHPDLDRFFWHYAGQNQFKLFLSVTWVAVSERRLHGFATVSTASIERDSVPNARLRKRLPAYPLPVVRLARLGVAVRAQGKGVGRALLGHVLQLAVEQRDQLGCVGVVTDSKPEAVEFYRQLGFVPLDGVRVGMLPSEPQPMFLGIEVIAAARPK